MATKTTRKVKRRNTKVVLTGGSRTNTGTIAKKQATTVVKKIKKTKTRRYLVYAIVCLVVMQVVRFLNNQYVFNGPDTPGGILFLIIIYLQFGLMFGFIGFCAAASVSYLRNLKE